MACFPPVVRNSFLMTAAHIRVVFFDAGGTLLRPAQPIGETYAAVARHYGQNWEPAELTESFKAAFKKRRPRPDHEVATNGDERTWWKLVVADTLDAVGRPESFPFDHYFEELYAVYARPELWRVFPEVFPVLDVLRERGVKLAVLSNWDWRLPPLLDALELTPYFDKILISGHHGAEKPSPKLYAAALAAFDLQPHEALLVGDDPLNDYWTPKKLGWHALLVERPHQDLGSVLGVIG